MTVVVTHTTPADGTFSATGAAAWDANHALSGIGTMAEQNANNVAITGGSISGVTLPAGGSTLQVQYNNAGAFGGMSGTSWNDTTRSLTVTGATLTANAPVMDLSQTWNNSGTTFTGYKLNVINTASGDLSRLMDLQVSGVSKFIFAKQGNNANCPALTTSGEMSIGRTNGGLLFGGSQDGNSHAFMSQVQFILRSNMSMAWSDSSGDPRNGTANLFLTSKAAANLRFGAADAASPVAQTLSVQSVVAGTPNTAGANLTITGSQGAGTGAGGSIVFQVAPAGSSGTAQNALATAMTIDSAKTVRLGTGYTVATLPAAGTAGRRTYVTDALLPTYLGALTGGGAVVCPVFDNGTAWVSA